MKKHTKRALKETKNKGKQFDGPADWVELDLADKDTYNVEVMLMLFMRKGKTIEQFLTHFNLRLSDWNRYCKKHSSIRKAITDGLVFYKSYWQEKAVAWSADKERQGALSKMLVEHALGWEESAQAAVKIKAKVGGVKGYKVIVKKPQPLPEMDADGIPLEIESKLDDEKVNGDASS